MLEGLDECSKYLVCEASKLLLNQAEAQRILLAEVTPVFTEEDNKMLEMDPTIEDVKEVFFKSNLNAAPGTDGITSLLYKEY